MSLVTSGPTKRVHCFPLYTNLGYKATASFLQPTTSSHCSDGLIEQPWFCFLCSQLHAVNYNFSISPTIYPYTMKDLTFYFSTSTKYNWRRGTRWTNLKFSVPKHGKKKEYIIICLLFIARLVQGAFQNLRINEQVYYNLS